jgi:hypothetical protein
LPKQQISHIKSLDELVIYTLGTDSIFINESKQKQESTRLLENIRNIGTRKMYNIVETAYL